MEKQKTDPLLMVAAVAALIATVYVLYITVFEQIISQNQGYFYAIIFGFILLVLFLLCNLFTKLIAVSMGEHKSSYRKLIVAIGLVVIASLFLITKMRYTTDLVPDDDPIYRGAVTMVDGSYAENRDLVDSALYNPGQYLCSLILSVVFRIAGSEARALQWTNAFFIILCGYLIYRIVKTFTNSLCGLFAALLCGFIPSQTFAVYTYSSEPMVTAIFLGTVFSLISLFSYNKRVMEMEIEDEKRDIGGILFTVIGSILMGLLLFTEPVLIIPMATLVIIAFVAHRSKALNMLLVFTAGIVIMVALCFAKSVHMDAGFGEVMTGQISAFDPLTNNNSGEVSEFGEVYHSFNVDLSSTDSNITENYSFISDASGAAAYTEMSASWVVVLNQIMYMFVLMMTISCMILAVKEQKDYAVALSVFVVGAVLMLLFQQNRDNQKFLFITVFIIASSTGIHYLYLDHHPELKVGINALDALEKTGRKEIAAATRTNLRNAAQMSDSEFMKRAKALIFIGNDEELYQRIKQEEHEMAVERAAHPRIVEESFDDYDEDFFLDNEDDVDDSQVVVTAVGPDGISKRTGIDAYEPNAQMHMASREALDNTDIPAWKRPEQFGDEEMFDEDELGLGDEHSVFEGRDSLRMSAGVTTAEPEPEVQKVSRNKKKINVKPSVKKDDVSENIEEFEAALDDIDKKAKKSKLKKEKKAKAEKPVKQPKAKPTPAENTVSGGKAVRRIKNVGGKDAATVKTVTRSAEIAPSEPIPNPLPVPEKKEYKKIDYDTDQEVSGNDADWDYDYDFDVTDDDDWDID